MSQPYLALITPLTGYPDQGLPGGGQGGGQPSHPINIPGLGPVHPIVIPGTPPGQPGSPTNPIYIPGNPSHPWVPPAGGGGGSGGHPSHPIHIPGVPDQGLPEGEEIPSNELPPIPVPPEHADDLIIGVRQPNSEEWTFTAYDVAPDQGQPQPQPHKGRGSRTG